MSKQLAEVKKVYGFLEKSLEQQEITTNTLRAVLKQMQGIEQNVIRIETNVEQKQVRMEEMLEEVRQSVTLTNAECYQLQSAVATRSIALTKDRIHEEEEGFTKVVGKYRRMIWKKLKETYDAPKYNCIRRIDFEYAVKFIERFSPEDYI